MTKYNNHVYELADAIREILDVWAIDSIAELCTVAGMRVEWDAADGDTFESVAFAVTQTPSDEN